MMPSNLNEQINSYLDLLPSQNIAFPSNAEGKAGDILRFIAYLLYLKHQTSCEHIAAKSLYIATYAKINDSLTLPEKTGVREKQARIEATPELLELNSKVELLDAEISHYRDFIRLFENGHIELRQIGKGLQ